MHFKDKKGFCILMSFLINLVFISTYEYMLAFIDSPYSASNGVMNIVFSMGGSTTLEIYF